MEQVEWGPRLVRVIAGEIRRHRESKRPKMSAQALADRCAELGWPIARSVLSNLESGYRETLTVPELMVIAQALGVTPLRLVVPLGQAETVEVMPFNPVNVTDAMRWIRGEGSHIAGFEDDDPVVSNFVAHAAEVSRWSWAVDLAASIREDGMEGDAERHDADAERARLNLKNIRATLRDRGLTPPALPPGLRIEEGRP